MKLLNVILCGCLLSCSPVYTTPDGHKYKLEHICLHYHIETITTPQTDLNTNSVVIVTQINYICDSEKIDTIWLSN